MPQSCFSPRIRSACLTLLGVMAATAVSGSALAETPQKFDLICTGSRVTAGAGQGGAAQQWTGSYRLDLPHMRYCSGDCKMVDRIADVSSDVVTLTNKETPYRTGSARLFSQYNRATGKLNLSVTARPDSLTTVKDTVDGSCVVQPFSGMPSNLSW